MADTMSKHIQLNMNNITKQEHAKAENKRATERIQSELRPKPDASTWYSQQANRNRSEESQRAAEIEGKKIREILQQDKKKAN